MFRTVPIARASGWRPYLGQQAPAAPAPAPEPTAAQAPPVTPPAPAAAAEPAPVAAPAPVAPPPAPSGWGEDVKRRLGNAAMGAAMGALVGGASHLAVPGGKLARKDAGLMALFGAALAAAATFIPFGPSRWVDAAATVGGAMAAGSATHVAFPRKG